MSMTRRTFLRGAVFSAGALPGLFYTRSAGLGPARYLQYDQVVFDSRSSHALAFAEAARGFGASIRAIRGDVRDAWFQDVCARWHARRMPVAGITDFRSLFLLQTMTAAAGLHLVLRIHHQMRGERAVHEAFGEHLYRTIAEARLSEARLADCGECWAHEAARLVLGLPERAASMPPRAGNLDEANLRTLGSRALVTWVLA